MADPIEDYALLSDLLTGTLISRSGSVDWACFPRFDSPSQFGALLGTEEQGRWLLSPSDPDAEVKSWSYLDSTFIVETQWSTSTGVVLVTDFMPLGHATSSILRRITGLEGVVEMRQELIIRPGYARIVPWTRRVQDHRTGETMLQALAGPDAMALRGPHLPEPHTHGHAGEFTVTESDVFDFELTWFPSHRTAPARIDVDAALVQATAYWKTWGSHCRSNGTYGQAVKRSLLVLRALTNLETGGIVAAPTTSLPEEFGGSRNWDYRYCWLRDAALTLESMLTHGYETEALQWRNWLLRALAG